MLDPLSEFAPRRREELRTARRIVVVEGDVTYRVLISGALADAGYEVLTAPSVTAGLKLVRQFPADLVMIDVGLPEPDVREFVATYRQRSSRPAPIVEIRPACADTAVPDPAGILTKPFGPAELLNFIRQYEG